MMVIAEIGKINYTTNVTAKKHSFILDEPHDLGGQDMGATPLDHLCAALASCIVITLKMYIGRKGWMVNTIKTQITKKPALKEGIPFFDVQLFVDGKLDEKQKDRLLKVAHKCPIHKILEKGTDIEITLNT